MQDGNRNDPRNVSAKPAFGFWTRRFKPCRSDSAHWVALRGPNSSCARCRAASRCAAAGRCSDDRDGAASGETHQAYCAASGKAHSPPGTAADKARGATYAAYYTPRGTRYSPRHAGHVELSREGRPRALDVLRRVSPTGLVRRDHPPVMSHERLRLHQLDPYVCCPRHHHRGSSFSADQTGTSRPKAAPRVNSLVLPLARVMR
jgi:hypothetical protein